MLDRYFLCVFVPAEHDQGKEVAKSFRFHPKKDPKVTPLSLWYNGSYTMAAKPIKALLELHVLSN